MDLLGGKYTIATNNISNDDVGSVEIMENHQPIKALNGLSISEQAAINLRLKESQTKMDWQPEGRRRIYSFIRFVGGRDDSHAF